MFYYVKKPGFGRRREVYDIYRDHKPFLILAPESRLYHREARMIVDILNRYYEAEDVGRYTTPQRRSDDTGNDNAPPRNS